MRIEVDFRLEDLEELYTPEVYAADPARYRRKMRTGFIGWIVSVSLLAGMYVFSAYTRSRLRIPQYENPRRDLQLDLITLALPGAFATLFTCIFIYKLWRSSRWRPKPPSPSAAKQHSRQVRIFAFALTIVVVAVTVVALTPELARDWRPSRGQVILMCWSPWLFVLLTFIGFGARLVNWQARRAWFTNPAFARHHVYELDEWGLKAWDDVSRYEKSWSTFVRVRESANLLILVHESTLMYPIPKRAFASQAELEAARALLQNKLENATFLAKPVGFPMTPQPVEPVASNP